MPSLEGFNAWMWMWMCQWHSGTRSVVTLGDGGTPVLFSPKAAVPAHGPTGLVVFLPFLPARGRR